MALISPTAVLLALVGGPQIAQSLLSMFPPFSSGIAEKGYSEVPNLIPPPGELVSARLKGNLDIGTFTDLMRKAGYSPELSEKMYGNSRAYLAALDYITAWRRGTLPEGELNTLLGEQGITPSDIATLKNVTIYYPTPQDLIRFGVRDVFTSSTIQKYGLDQDYPDLLDAAAAKAGLDPTTSRQYWMAHWFLPSNTEIFEMLHRRIINEDDVKTFLKVNDFMPYWRDKLMQISYDVLTRVDVRRMYALGVLTESEVNSAYQDMGYKPSDADKLTQFTVLEAKHGTTSTPTSLIVDAYKAGFPGNSKPVPDGAKMAKIHWAPKPNEFFKDASVPGKLVNVDFMVKDSKRFADSGGWGYAVFD